MRHDAQRKRFKTLYQTGNIHKNNANATNTGSDIETDTCDMIEQRNLTFAAIVLLIFVISILKLVLHDCNCADMSIESRGIRWQPMVYMAR